MIEQNPIMPDRRYWNVLKGIGILCVVLGHACSWAHDFVYEFHIPLFFFISAKFRKLKYSVPIGIKPQRIRELCNNIMIQ